MKSYWRRILLTALAALALICLFTGMALAENSEFTIKDGVLTAYTGSSARITIPDGVTSIGKSAFKGNKSITSVTIPSGVTGIGEYAFQNCTGLANVVLPDTLKTMGTGAFAGSGVKIVTIPGSLKTVPAAAFANCASLTTVTLSEGVTETAYAYYTSGIGYDYGPFKNCAALSTVRIPSTMKTMGAYTFYGCSGLKTVTIANGLQTIGNYAFAKCTRMTSIVLPSSLRTIGEYAFYTNEALSSINVPSGVASIGEYAFQYCKSLATVSLPNTLKTMGAGAFSNNASLKSITLPGSLETIPGGAFFNCASLTTVTISEGVQSTGYLYHPTNCDYDCGAFRDCTSLTTVRIPSTMVSLSKFTFFGCSRLTNVTIADGLQDIGESAFESCIRLESIKLPGSLLKIQAKAFRNCTELSSLAVPMKVTLIGEYAFQNCSALSAVTLGASLNEMGAGAFAKTGVKSVTIPGTLAKIPGGAFYGCASLTNVTISEGVKYTGYEYHPTDCAYECGSFRDCTALTTLSIPSTMLSIEKYSFYGCKSLKNVTIAEGLQTIYANAFEKCTSLASLTLPNSLTQINENAFWGCTALGSIVIPNNVTNIGNCAFQNCTSLSSVTLSYSLRTMGTGAFSMSGVKSVEIPGSLNRLPGGAFFGCKSLTSVVISEGVKTIGYEYHPANCDYDCGAFRGCTALKSVKIPSSVQTIESFAFYGCSSLSNLSIAEGVQVVQKRAFENCASLGRLLLPASMDEFGADIFKGCNNLVACAYIDSPVYSYCETNSSAQGFTYESRGQMPVFSLEWSFDSQQFSELRAPSAGMQGSVLGVVSNTDWTVTAPEWVRVTPAGGNSDGSFTVSVMENKDAAPRDGYILVSAYGCPDLMMYVYQEEPKFTISALTLKTIEPKVGEDVMFEAQVNMAPQFIQYTVTNAAGTAVAVIASDTNLSWIPTEGGDYIVSAVGYDGLTWSALDSQWFHVKAPLQFKSLSCGKSVYASGEKVVFSADLTGDMQFICFTVIDQWGNEVFRNTGTALHQDWSTKTAGDYKGIAIAYDGQWHSAETGWFTVSPALSIKGVAPVKWENLTTANTIDYYIDFVGVPQFLSYTIVDAYGNKAMESYTTEHHVYFKPPYASDYRISVVGYDGSVWSSAQSGWTRVSNEAAVVKGLAASSGSLTLGGSLTFKIDMTGPFQFASYTVYNQYGAKVASDVIAEKKYTFTPTAEGDYYCEVVVYDGANWLAAKTGWIPVRPSETKVNGLVSKRGAYALGETMAFAIDMTGNLNFAKFTVYNHYGSEVASDVVTAKSYTFKPTYADDYYCEVVVYDGTNWHSAKTGWINVAG